MSAVASIWKPFFLLMICGCCERVLTQSNYASQANNVEYQGVGLPEQALLDGKVTKLDDLSPIIFLNRTKAALYCGAGSMQIELKFNEKFYGIAYADFDRNSACTVAGKGDLSYKLELPLKGCGTRQDPQRVFTNNIVVRFHPNLEMEGDEVITIVCRYPPPIAPPPAGLPSLVIQDPVLPAAAIEPPLKGFQILLIICAIMFLSLLLLGLAVSYYCLRRRPIIIPRQPLSIGSGSEITKLSGSSMGNLSMFEGLKIPRAHAPVQATASTSGSEGPLISDTIPSDYPSESHSEVEDAETRSLPVSSAGSYENRAFVHETSSFYSEGYGHTQELKASNATAVQAIVPRLPLPVKAEPQPKFDVQVRVKRAPPPPPSPPLTSDTESTATTANGRTNLDTIMEQREESIRTLDSPRPTQLESSQFTYTPDIHQPPPRYAQTPPVYSRILRKQQEQHEQRISWPEEYVDGPPVSSARSIASLNTEMTDTHSVTEMVDDSHSKLFVKERPPPPQRYSTTLDMESEIQEPPIAITRKPEITSHVVDDVYLRTIKEKRTIEEEERYKRIVTEYTTKPKIVDTKWDVTIRNYPGSEMTESPEWENFSDVSSASNLTLTPKPERAELSLPPPNYISETGKKLYSPELVGSIDQHGAPPVPRHMPQQGAPPPPPPRYTSVVDIPPEDPNVPNWNVLIRVLKPMEFDLNDFEQTTEYLTTEDKVKWRHIITTESTLRTMLTEATVREDFERIRHDVRYETLFEPHKWDVIIRILAPPQDRNKTGRYRKKNDWDTRSRRSSLPTLYEYDSDGASSVRTITQDPTGLHLPTRSRRTSRSSYRSDNIDMRSMSEMTVDFARPDRYDTMSEASSYHYQPGAGRYYDPESDVEGDFKSDGRSLIRSLSQPSLVRSASEFTERWIAPGVFHDTTGSELSSPEATPKSARSDKMTGGSPYGVLTTFKPPKSTGPGAATSSVWRESSSEKKQEDLPGGGKMITESQFVSESSSQYKSWYGDGDSEASYK